METAINNTHKKQKLFAKCKIEMTRKGLKIYCKSSILEKFFKKMEIHNNEDIESQYLDQNGEKIKIKQINGGDQILQNATVTCSRNHPLFTREGYLNLSFLRMGGITKGKTFYLQGIFPSNTIERFVRDMKNALEEIYTQYFEQQIYHISFSIEERRLQDDNKKN